jgi:hypothetical protein
MSETLLGKNVSFIYVNNGNVTVRTGTLEKVARNKKGRFYMSVTSGATTKSYHLDKAINIMVGDQPVV